jgi:hypothetical protein
LKKKIAIRGSQAMCRGKRRATGEMRFGGAVFLAGPRGIGNDCLTAPQGSSAARIGATTSFASIPMKRLLFLGALAVALAGTPAPARADINFNFGFNVGFSVGGGAGWGHESAYPYGFAGGHRQGKLFGRHRARHQQYYPIFPEQAHQHGADSAKFPPPPTPEKKGKKGAEEETNYNYPYLGHTPYQPTAHYVYPNYSSYTYQNGYSYPSAPTYPSYGQPAPAFRFDE